MPFDYREIALAAKKALGLVEDPERRRALEDLVDNTAPLVEARAREELQGLVEEINAQLSPQARLRLVQEGTRLVAEVVPLGEDQDRNFARQSEGDTIAKLLVRMPSGVKDRANESARRAGMSLNGWTVNILERALENLRKYQPEGQEPESRRASGADGAPEGGVEGASEREPAEPEAPHPSPGEADAERRL